MLRATVARYHEREVTTEFDYRELAETHRNANPDKAVRLIDGTPFLLLAFLIYKHLRA